MSAAETAVAALCERPLYLRAQPWGNQIGEALGLSTAHWPRWRSALLARQPGHTPRTADVQLLNGWLWAPGMLRLACAFVEGAYLSAQLGYSGAGEQPYGTLLVRRARLWPQADPLPATVGALLGEIKALKPVLVMSELLLMRESADRLLQALLLLGQVTGGAGRAERWAARLTGMWPVSTSAALLPGSTGTVWRRGCCCYQFMSAGGTRCDNCPSTPSSKKEIHYA